MTARRTTVKTAAWPHLEFERPLWEAGCLFVAGIDEAGRGALAGPVAAGAVVLPASPDILDLLSGVRDSKLMSPKQRQTWAGTICEQSAGWAVGTASSGEIDQIGIVPATRLAACRALNTLAVVPGHLLLDFLRLPDVDLPQTALVKGDRRSLSIAAASVLAKTTRDTLLEQLDARYPGYGFAKHKGYGTAAHRAALRQLGPSPVHRRTFQPIRQMVFGGWDSLFE
jgi:ribonuclease HII